MNGCPCHRESTCRHLTASLRPVLCEDAPHDIHLGRQHSPIRNAIISYLSQHPDWTTARDIADATGYHRPSIAHLLRNLSNNAIVQSLDTHISNPTQPHVYYRLPTDPEKGAKTFLTANTSQG